MSGTITIHLIHAFKRGSFLYYFSNLRLSDTMHSNIQYQNTSDIIDGRVEDREYAIAIFILISKIAYFRCSVATTDGCILESDVALTFF